MKKVFILIFTGYITGLLGAASFFLIFKPANRSERNNPLNNPQEMLISNPDPAYFEPEMKKPSAIPSNATNLSL